MPTKSPTSSNPVADWFGSVKEAVGQKITEKHDEALASTAEKVLDSVGKEAFRYIEDPFTPEPLKGLFSRAYWRAWSEIRVELRDEVVRSFGWDKLHYQARRTRLENWPKKPGLFKCCNPRYSCCGAVAHFFRVLRARFLYADQPADGSYWSVLSDPLGLVLFCLKMYVPTSVGTFVLLFFLMDRRDEAQLVRFILKFKTFMFFTAGIAPAAYLGYMTHGCLAAIEAGRPQVCIEEAPSSSEYFQLSLFSEIVRLGFIWFAFGLLACGHAVGGDEEIAALEEQRLLAQQPTPRPEGGGGYTHGKFDEGEVPTDRLIAEEVARVERLEAAHAARTSSSNPVAAAAPTAGASVRVESVRAEPSPAASVGASDHASSASSPPPATSITLPPPGGRKKAGDTSAAVAPLSRPGAQQAATAAASSSSYAETAAEPSPRVADPSKVQRQLEVQRAQWGASRRAGGALPYFLALDALILLVLVGTWVVVYAWPNSCGGYVQPFTFAASDFFDGLAQGELRMDSFVWLGFDGCQPLDSTSALLWSSLYNLKLSYGLLSFPFLVFELPIIGETLIKVRYTAYDQTGLLVPQLGKAEVATLYERRGGYQAVPQGDLNA